MDRQLLERMIGAAVLVVVLILVVPAILTGPEPEPVADPALPRPRENLRQLTIRPGGEAPAPVSAAADQPESAPLPETMSEPQAKAAAAPAPERAQRAVAAAEKPRATAAAEPAPASAPQTKPKPEAAPAPASVPESTRAAAARATGWVVQLGSFASKPNAEGLASKVKAAGYDCYLVPLDRDGKTLYRVRVGPPDEQRSKAEQLAGRLARAGYRGQVTRQEAGG